MAIVYVGLGSNIDPEDNLHLGISELRERYGELLISAVYRSKAVGFDGDDFLNLVVRFESDASPAEICETIELIHNLTGRDRNSGKWESRPLDIDLLLYNDLVMDVRSVRVPRDDVLKYSFVLRQSHRQKHCRSLRPGRQENHVTGWRQELPGRAGRRAD